MNERKAFTLTELIVVIAVVAILALLPITALGKTKAGSLRIMCVNNLKQVGLAFRQWADRNADRYPMHVSAVNGGPNFQNNINSTATFAGTPMPSQLWTVFEVMSNELNTPKILACPSESTASKVQATVFTRVNPGPGGVAYNSNNNLSYFIGVDAAQTNPRMILTGDHNIGAGSAANNTLAAVTLWQNILIASTSGNMSTNNPTAAWTEGNHQKRGNVCLTDGSVQQLNIEKLRDTLKKTGDVQNRTCFP